MAECRSERFFVIMNIAYINGINSVFGKLQFEKNKVVREQYFMFVKA